MMKLHLDQVDAFAEQPFQGNPAAVCRLDKWLEDTLMQQIATEMNLSETAFLVSSGPDAFRLRWFTPAAEVDLCGHATLASAHVVFEKGWVDAPDPVRFETLSGILSVRRLVDGRLEMDFPAEPVDRDAPDADWAAILGAEPAFVGANRMDILVEIEGEDRLRGLNPDQAGLAATGARGVIVTARADVEGLDIVSRFFAPLHGIPEDPVTGSAHCCLAPYWAGKLGRATLRACQASSRGGRLDLEVCGERILLRGNAVTVLSAEMTLP